VIGQLAYDGNCLFPRGRSVPQFHPFLVRHNAAAEAELKEIERHGFFFRPGKRKQMAQFRSASQDRVAIT
jgi:hypothetical protein